MQLAHHVLASPAIQLAHEVLAKNVEPYPGVTIARFGEEVLTWRELSRHLSRPENDWSRWKNHMNSDPIAKMPVKAVREIHIEDWMDPPQREGSRAPDTRRRVQSTIGTSSRVTTTSPGTSAGFGRPAEGRARNLRRSAGLTQAGAAERAKLDYKHYQAIEGGSSNITVTSLIGIAKALKVKPAALFDDV